MLLLEAVEGFMLASLVWSVVVLRRVYKMYKDELCRRCLVEDIVLDAVASGRCEQSVAVAIVELVHDGDPRT